MKKTFTITMDAELLSVAKRYARSRGVSMSSLIEQSLRVMVSGDEPSFSRSPPSRAQRNPETVRKGSITMDL